MIATGMTQKPSHPDEMHRERRAVDLRQANKLQKAEVAQIQPLSAV